MDTNFAINIGRQLGSGGHEIGEKLAKRLGISFYDDELITLASEASGLSREHFERADEKSPQGFFGTLLGGRFPYINEGAMPLDNCLSNDALFNVESAVIRRLARQQSCVFVGRCADYVLRNHPRVLNVFVTCSDEERIKRLSALRGITAEAAEALMRKADKKRAEYHDFYSTTQWGVSSTYHLSIDSSLLGLDATVDLIEQVVKQRFG